MTDRTPIRVRMSRAKGAKLPPNTVVVARPSPWGNPFVVGKHGTRAECVHLFKLMLTGSICVSKDHATSDAQLAYLKHAGTNLEQLRGKNLACWCTLDGPCHADALLEIANHASMHFTPDATIRAVLDPTIDALGLIPAELATPIVNALIESSPFRVVVKAIDPTAGSGTFLAAAKSKDD